MYTDRIALDAYIRVSRVAGRDGDSFISPQVQRETIERWAGLRGVEIAQWHDDLDVSGGKLERPGLDALMERIRTKQTQGVAVARLDRLSRAGVTDALKLVEEIHEHGGQLAAVDLGIDPTTAFGEFGLTIMLALGRMERRRITEGWATAQERAVARGVHIASRTPTGYVRGKGGRLEPHPTDAKVVAELFRMRAAGASWGELADHLNQRGVVGPYKAPLWTQRAISHIIENRAYLGEARSGQFRNPDAHPAIIDRGTWEAAQRERGPTPLRSEDGAALAGLLRCAGCRFVLKPDTIIDRDGSKLRQYRCRKTHSTGVCPSPVAILERKVLPAVEGTYLQILQSKGRFTVEAQIGEAADVSALEAAVTAAEAELAAFRDDERIIGALGADRYVEGLERRAKAADEAIAALAEASTVSAPTITKDFEDEVWPTWSISKKRASFFDVFDCWMVRKGRDKRLWPMARGTMPDDFPRRGKRVPPKPFEFPPEAEEMYKAQTVSSVG